MGVLEGVGKKILAFLQIVGEMLKLLGQTLYSFREAPRNLQSIFSQMSIIGYETLPIASVMGFFVGMVLALQTGSELAEVWYPGHHRHHCRALHGPRTGTGNDQFSRGRSGRIMPSRPSLAS